MVQNDFLNLRQVSVALQTAGLFNRDLVHAFIWGLCQEQFAASGIHQVEIADDLGTTYQREPIGHRVWHVLYRPFSEYHSSHTELIEAQWSWTGYRYLHDPQDGSRPVEVECGISWARSIVASRFGDNGSTFLEVWKNVIVDRPSFAAFLTDAHVAEKFGLIGIEKTQDMADCASSSQSRAPAVKKGNPPSREAILAKADEMKSRGYNRDEIASRMRHEPGFHNVATTEVRELLKGRWRRGRPRTLAQENLHI